MIKIQIDSSSKSAALYDALWKSIQNTLEDYRDKHDDVLLGTTTTGTFSPNK